MATTRGHILGSESVDRPGSKQKIRLAASRLLALAMAVAFMGCTPISSESSGTGGKGGSSPSGGRGGSGGKAGSGGSGAAGTGGSGGSADTAGAGGGGATGGSGGTGGDTGGTAGADASATPDDGGVTSPDDAAGTTADTAGPAPSDGPPAAMRPDAMGQECKSAANENFTISAFDPPQKGVFTAWFSVTPSIAPTNSVVGLSDGDVGPGSGNTPLHNLHQILLRFGASGALDARNGATYTADSVIKYEAIQYDFRLVVDLPNKKWSAYVSWKGQPEVTIGTNLAYRDSAAVPTKFDHWAVEANTQKTTVCGFIVSAN